MNFTNDDLKRLKAKEGYWKTTVKMNEGQSESWGFVDGDKIDALIARLEAAEEIVNKIYELDSSDLNGLTMEQHNTLVDDVVNATDKWLKLKGAK